MLLRAVKSVGLHVARYGWFLVFVCAGQVVSAEQPTPLEPCISDCPDSTDEDDKISEQDVLSRILDILNALPPSDGNSRDAQGPAGETQAPQGGHEILVADENTEGDENTESKDEGEEGESAKTKQGKSKGSVSFDIILVPRRSSLEDLFDPPPSSSGSPGGRPTSTAGTAGSSGSPGGRPTSTAGSGSQAGDGRPTGTAGSGSQAGDGRPTSTAGTASGDGEDDAGTNSTASTGSRSGTKNAKGNQANAAGDGTGTRQDPFLVFDKQPEGQAGEGDGDATSAQADAGKVTPKPSDQLLVILADLDASLLEYSRTYNTANNEPSSGSAAQTPAEGGILNNQASIEATEQTDYQKTPVPDRNTSAGTPATMATSTKQKTRYKPPPDLADGRNDDIVARQLREAAMAETDPELQERLWEEYRKYKNL